MDISNMKNIVVLKNLPSNLAEEAIVVLKENKKVKKYQYIKSEENKNVDKSREKTNKNANNLLEKKSNEYIVKEAEMIINSYLLTLEEKSPKVKNNIKKLENKYKKSLKLNFILGFATVISLLLSFA